MKKILASLAAIAVLGLTGCNTVAGAGKDVSAVGNATTNAAKDTSKKIDEKPACTTLTPKADCAPAQKK
jgi:entericidin B